MVWFPCLCVGVVVNAHNTTDRHRNGLEGVALNLGVWRWWSGQEIVVEDQCATEPNGSYRDGPQTGIRE